MRSPLPIRTFLLAGAGALAMTIAVRPLPHIGLADEKAPLIALIATLMIAVPTGLDRPITLPAQIACAAMGFVLALSLFALLGPPSPAAMRLYAASIVALLTFVVGSACALAPAKMRQVAYALTLLALASVTMAPVWLAGWLDAVARMPGMLDTLVAINPLTAVCAAAETDFLRTDWFYRHSPLGSLRFDYPPPTLVLFAYGLLAIGLSWLLMRRDLLAKTCVFANDHRS